MKKPPGFRGIYPWALYLQGLIPELSVSRVSGRLFLGALALTMMDRVGPRQSVRGGVSCYSLRMLGCIACICIYGWGGGGAWPGLAWPGLASVAHPTQPPSCPPSSMLLFMRRPPSPRPACHVDSDSDKATALALGSVFLVAIYRQIIV